ncbi:MAG: hypothetical protein ABDH18_03030 [Aquificaceae bacterium]
MVERKSISREELKELYDKDFPLWAQINYQLLKRESLRTCGLGEPD